MGQNIKLFGISILASFGLTVIIVATFLSRRHKKPPRRWRRIGELSQIFMYPIKSCAAKEVDQSFCTFLGLTTKHPAGHDRMFLVVDNDGIFLTGRKYPRMVKIKADLLPTGITLSAPNSPSIRVDVCNVNGEIPVDRMKTIRVRVWKDWVTAFDCGDEVAVWLSQYLMNSNGGARLVFHLGQESPRQIDGSYRIFKDLTANDNPIFADLVSFSLLHKNSLDDVNERLRLQGRQEISPLNFRPNFVIKTDEAPYSEDRWRWLKIGDAIFKKTNPCSRCVFTTVDPFTGVKDEMKEPLTTLRSYRLATDRKERKLFGQSPLFCICLGLDRNILKESLPGVAVGDPIYVEEFSRVGRWMDFFHL